MEAQWTIESGANRLKRIVCLRIIGDWEFMGITDDTLC